jgi:hypothetical protein
MKPSLELFKLIKSLTKSEKRFFKLMSSLQEGDKNYLKIFDYIDARESYNEEELKRHFKGEVFIKHLPSEKNQLYKLILKSLRAFHSEETVSSTLKLELQNVEMLYNKALFKECEKFLTRAKNTAKEYEEFYYWFEFLSWEKRLLENAYESGVFTKDLDKLIEEEESVIAKLRNLAEYQIIYSKIDKVFRSGGFTKSLKESEVVEEIANYHLIKGKDTALSVKASSMCYYIKGLCAASQRDYNLSFTFFNKTREILDRNPKIKYELGQRYVMTMSHLLRCYIEVHDFENAQSVIDEMRELEGKKGFNSVDITLKIFTRSFILELMLLHVMGDFRKCIQLIPVIERKELQFGEMVSKEQTLLFNYYKAYSFFGVGDYKKALYYLNIVLNDTEQKLRQDIYSYARLFNLILHYELGNYDFLEYLLKSTNRYFVKKEFSVSSEIIFIKHMGKLSKAVNNNERLLIFEFMKDELEEILSNHDERVVLQYFDILAWITCKTYKITFSEAVRSRLEL